MVSARRPAPAVLHHPQRGADAGLCEAAGREASPGGGVLDSQTGEGAVRRSARPRRGQVDRRSQAPHSRGYGRTAAYGEPHICRFIGSRGRAANPECHPQVLAMAVATVRRRGLRPHEAYPEGRVPRLRDRDRPKLLHGKTTGFEDIPRRCVVERTFGWMIRWRRLVRDYERHLDMF